MGYVVILKMGGTFPSLAAARGDFEDWVYAGLELPRTQVRVCHVAEGAPPPPLLPSKMRRRQRPHLTTRG